MRILRVKSVCIPLVCGLLFTGCTVTTKEPLKRAEVNCMILGAVCDKLVASTEKGPDYMYFDNTASWKNRKKVLIQPVSYWSGNSKDATPEDQQHLLDYFHKKLVTEFSKSFEIVEKTGPGVMIYSAALGDVEESTPVLRSISMFVPQAHMLSNITYLATDAFPFVGRAVIEAKLVDSETGRVMVAEADRQAGGGMFTNGAQWKWGDAEHAIDFWIEREVKVLAAWTSGSVEPGKPLAEAK